MQNEQIKKIIESSPYAGPVIYDPQQENYAFDMIERVDGHPDVVVPCRVAPFAETGINCAMASAAPPRVELTLFQGLGYASLGFALHAFFG